MNLTLSGSYVVTIAALSQNNRDETIAGGGLSETVVTMTLEQDVTADGRVLLKKGSRLIGYLTAAPWRYHAQGPESAPADSTLAIVFDRIVSSDGREAPIAAGTPVE